MNVGEKIKKFRELKNFTQSYMADNLELSLSGYGKIERNETDISISRLESIAEVLGTDIATILTFDEKNVFNFNNNENANGIVQNHYAVQDDLIERIIQQHKEENKYLKGLIEKMLEKQQK
jgi:transcriptional regulator with XRE-family HTH domain